MSLEIYKAALDWLDKGFHLLPIQPNTKKQVQGFGLHQQHITNMQQAAHWFNNLSKFNLAVIAPEDKFIIDFDDWGHYLWWVRFVKMFCDAPSSYTEITPNDGAHVFINGQIPPTFNPIPHVEIKRVVLVAPSVLEKGLPYEVMIEGGMYSGSLDAVLFPLSKTPPQLAPASRAARVAPPNLARSNKLDRIKAKFSILDLINKHFPKTIFKGRGRFMSACCPFHKETEASFWIDTERNLFGCHACKVKGDVINLFALIHNLDNSKAIEEMSKGL